MTMQNELTFEQLVDWVENRLAPAEAAVVAEQVAANPTAQTEVAWLRALGQTSNVVKLTKLPVAVRTALVEQFTQLTRDKEQPGFFQRLFARLTFDSSLQPAAVGVRAAEFGRTRQLVYATGVADVAINLQPRPLEQGMDVLGQILLNDDAFVPDEFSIQLLQESREVGMTLADDLGEFTFAGIQPGRYQLILSTDMLDIQLPDLDLSR